MQHANQLNSQTILLKFLSYLFQQPRTNPTFEHVAEGNGQRAMAKGQIQQTVVRAKFDTPTIFMSKVLLEYNNFHLLMHCLCLFSFYSSKLSGCDKEHLLHKDGVIYYLYFDKIRLLAPTL